MFFQTRNLCKLSSLIELVVKVLVKTVGGWFGVQEWGGGGEVYKLLRASLRKWCTGFGSRFVIWDEGAVLSVVSLECRQGGVI